MTTVTNKNGIEFDIDAIATDLNGKADRDLVNCTNPRFFAPYIESRVAVDGGIVEIWSDGYCVQTGVIDSVVQNNYNAATVTLPQPYKDTNYIVLLTQWDNGQTLGLANSTGAESVHSKTTSSFVISAYSWTYGRMWRTEGYIR